LSKALLRASLRQRPAVSYVSWRVARRRESVFDTAAYSTKPAPVRAAKHLGLVTRANQYVDQTAPFKLAKDPAQAKRLDEVLYQSDGNLPGAGGFALAISAWNGSENLRANSV